MPRYSVVIAMATATLQLFILINYFMILFLKNTIRQLAQNRALQHFLFWVISFVLLLRYFAYQSEIVVSDYIYTALFHLSLIVIVYLNLRVLIPFLLQKNRFGWYFVSVLVLLFLGIRLNEFTFNTLSDWVISGYFFISYYEFWELFYFFLIYWSASTLFKFSKAWFTLAETRQRLNELQAAKLQAELDGLKTQINPHFLFNALNSIYALAIDNQKQTPKAILKLSAVLRYILYESNEAKVGLQKEVRYLNDYIEVQKMRLENGTDIQFKINGNIKNKAIAPLLLLPFVENGFKHGLKGDTENMFLHILLEVTNEAIIFKTKNNQGELDELSKSKGIGLENVKKRLKLIYPNQNELLINNHKDTFEIILKIFI